MSGRRVNKRGLVERKCEACGRWDTFGLSFPWGDYFCPECLELEPCKAASARMDVEMAERERKP